MLFLKKNRLQESVTETAKRIYCFQCGKLFDEEKFVKTFMLDVCDVMMCPEVKNKFENISLSRQTIGRRPMI